MCIRDRIEAALDDVNVTRFAQYLRRISSETQFIVITHRRGTMEEADVLYGVKMCIRDSPGCLPDSAKSRKRTVTQCQNS